MALLEMHYFSTTLRECSSMDVVVPESGLACAGKMPILWLLPPVGMDHTAWRRHAVVEELAERFRVIAAMPDMRLSFGADMVHGEPYQALLTQELPGVLGRYIPADPVRQLLFGAKEGGYAALRAALLHPQAYMAACGADCGCVTRMTWQGRKAVWASWAFGTEDTQSLRGTNYDLAALAERCGDSPRLFLYAGEDAEYAQAGRLLLLEVPRIREIAAKGAGWAAWSQALSAFLELTVPRA